MKLDRAHASIEVMINGQPATMLLDTGADQVVLGAAAAERLGLNVQATATPGAGAGGTYIASTTSISDLAVGDIHQQFETAYVVPLPDEFLYDGALGTPFFAKFVMTLDYERGEVILRSGTAFEPSSDAERFSIDTESGGLFVIASAAGVTGRYAVDTGPGNALTMHTATVNQYGLRDMFAPAVDMIIGVSAGGYTTGRVVRLPEVSIGPYVFSSVVGELSTAATGVFASSRSLGNLGGELWRRFTITLDYADGWMYLTPNATFSTRFEGPKSGLVASLVNRNIEIIDVVDGSPASEAGAQIGQQILAVNGTRVDLVNGATDSTSLEAVGRALRGPPGAHVPLLVRDRSGSERELSLVLRELL